MGTVQWFGLDPLNLAILETLPDEGTKVGKYLPAGVAISEMPKKIDPAIKRSVYAGRIFSLTFRGYTVRVHGAGAADVLYQRTEKGRQALEGKKK